MDKLLAITWTAFQETVRRLLKIHNTFLKALDEGFVPAGEDAQTLLYESDHDDYDYEHDDCNDYNHGELRFEGYWTTGEVNIWVDD